MAPPPPRTSSTPPASHAIANPRRIEHRGATFDSPRNWQEESIVLLQAPGNKPRPTMTLVRATVPAGTGLDLYAARKLAETSTLIPNLQIEGMREVQVDGRRGVIYDVGWEVPEEGRYFQRTLYVIVDSSAFVLTGSCPVRLTPELEPCFAEVLGSLRFAHA